MARQGISEKDSPEFGRATLILHLFCSFGCTETTSTQKINRERIRGVWNSIKQRATTNWISEERKRWN